MAQAFCGGTRAPRSCLTTGSHGLAVQVGFNRSLKFPYLQLLMARDRARNNPVNPPLYEDALNQQGYNPATDKDGRKLTRNNRENSNLLPQQSSNNGSALAKISLTITILLGFFLITAISMIIVTIHSHHKQVQDRIGREWEIEERAHQVIRDTWKLELQAMVVARESWQKERTDIILDREAMAAERERWRREIIDHENRQHQEEEEKWALIVWQDLKASTQCLRFGTREYSATLAQVPLGMDPLKECWKKSIDIYGRQLFPSRCDTQGMCGTVTGHWIVDFDSSCHTWWRWYDNKGCAEQGIRRYESVLQNLQRDDDWRVMCATTPITVQGRKSDGPSSCARWGNQINGTWLIEDKNCHEQDFTLPTSPSLEPQSEYIMQL